MKADELRAISEKAQSCKADNFWESYSINLYEHLEREAEGGSTAVKIGNKDPHGLNPHDWLSCPNLYKKVIAELKAEGLEVTHSNDLKNGTYIYIKW